MWALVITGPVQQYAGYANPVHCNCKLCAATRIIAELGTCILVALALHSSCAHCSLHPRCVLAFWLHGACTLTIQGQHSNLHGAYIIAARLHSTVAALNE